MIIETEHIVLFRLPVQRNDHASVVDPEPQLAPRGQSPGERPGPDRFVDVQDEIEFHLLQDQPALRLPDVHPIQQRIIGKKGCGVGEGDPEDTAVGILPLERRENACRHQDIPHRIKIDDQDCRPHRVEVDTLPVALCSGKAGFVSGKMLARGDRNCLAALPGCGLCALHGSFRGSSSHGQSVSSCREA